MKRFIVKVYSSDGATYLGTLPDVTDIAFNKKINAGLGELVLKLPRLIDDFGEGGIIDWMNRIEVIIADNDAPTGTKVYSGYIDSWRPTQTNSQEFVDVLCLGYPSMMENAIHRNGNDITMSYTSDTTKTILEDIIDKYQTFHTDSPIDYSTGTIATGNTISISLNSMTTLDAIDRIIENAGANWFWYVDADNVFYASGKPSSATHTFKYGGDIAYNFGYDKSIRDVKNRLLFSNGQFATDPNPISRVYYKDDFNTTYWNRYDKLTDSRITSTTTAQNLADAYLEANQVNNHQISMIIADNNYYRYGYDIETIEPGDTCKILNVFDSAIFSDNMLITEVNYSLDSVELILEDLRSLTSRQLTKIRRRLDRRTYDDGYPNVTFTDLT